MSCTPSSYSPSNLNSDGGIASDDQLPANTPLVGEVGQDEVHQMFVSLDPLKAILSVQSRAGLKNPKAKPLLGLLDALHVPRLDSHTFVMNGAKDQLLARLAALDADHLVSLLDASFPYIGVPDLREIPLRVLGLLHPVPSIYLKQLASDTELFEELPLTVKQQVWELDKVLMMSHAAPLVKAYTWETSSLITSLKMGIYLTQAPTCLTNLPTKGVDARGLLALLPTRRTIRGGSLSLKKLVQMVGTSATIHKGISELCAAKLRDTDSLYFGIKEAALCSLRSQLTMVLHDNNPTADMAKKDEVHQLAWLLDACMTERCIDSKKIQQLRRIFHDYEINAASSIPKSRKRDYQDMDAMSGGPVASDNRRAPTPVNKGLVDAAMVLRDPASLHLLLLQVLKELERSVTEQLGMPKEDPDLVFLTRLVQLAVGCRTMMRERKYTIPPASQLLLHDFLPLLGNMIIEYQNSPEEASKVGDGKPDPTLVELLVRDEIVRKLTQMFCLQRLVAKDLRNSATLLASLGHALAAMSAVALSEWAPFAASLAESFTDLYAAGFVTPEDLLWRLGLERILLRCCDSELKVHEEVLRLLIRAGRSTKPERLVEYVEASLSHSRISRKRFQAKFREDLEEGPEDVSYLSGDGGGDLYGDATTPETVSAKGTDGVSFSYQKLLKLLPAHMEEDVAEKVHRYLSEDHNH